MKVVNFSHPFTPLQREQLRDLVGDFEEVEVRVQLNLNEELEGQMTGLVRTVNVAWQTEAVVINPPGMAPASNILLAVLHGLSGHFPATLRLRPVAGATPPQFEVAEVVNLQEVRARARAQR